jgi:hypothetical protein
MNNDKLPYSLDDNSSSFQTLATSSVCRRRQPVPPVYLNVRKETLNHVNIGDPANPYDYSEILSKVIIYANDVAKPFLRLIKESYQIPQKIPYPCENTPGEIDASIELEQWRAIASGTFYPIAYAQTIGLLAGVEDFVGVDQVVYYCASGEFPYVESDFDIDIDLVNGDPSDPTKPGGTGYTLLKFTPDNPDDLNGPGAYFFVVEPLVRVKLISDPS